MEEKIELFNNAINEKTNEIDMKIEELKANKETSVERLLKDKEDLENELGKVGLEGYIAEEYRSDLEKINSEIENQENILEEKTQELIEEKRKAERAKESYRIWSSEKDKQEESIKNNNETIEKLNVDKASLEEELKNDRLESYIKDEYNQNLAKVNDEISSLTQQNEQKANRISELENRMATLEDDYDIESYVQKQEEIKREAEEQRKAEEAKRIEEEKRMEEEKREAEESKENKVESAESETKKQYVPPIASVYKMPKTEPNQQVTVDQNVDPKNEKDSLEIDEHISVNIGQQGIIIEYSDKDNFKEWDIPLNEIKKINIHKDYFQQLMNDYKVDNKYKDLVDNNILIAINELNKVMPREKTEKIMSEYFKVIQEDKCKPEDLAQFGHDINIFYDRRNIDYLKPRNILRNKFTNRDEIEHIRQSADIAERLNIANIIHDEPGILRRFISKFSDIKNKVKLLGNGKKTQDKNSEYDFDMEDLEPKDVEDIEIEDVEDIGKENNTYSLKERFLKFKEELHNEEAAEESNRQHSETVIKSDGDVLEKPIEKD